jgi:hypothetical protein
MRGIGSIQMSAAPHGVGKMATGSMRFGVGKMSGGVEAESRKSAMKANEGLEKLMAAKGKK